MTPLLPDPDAVIVLAERLRQARNLVAQLESEWAKLFAVQTEPDREENEAPSRTSLTSRIVRSMETRPLGAFTVAQVASELDAKPSSVASILSRLVKAGLIEKRSASEYGAKRRPMPPDLATLSHHVKFRLREKGFAAAADILEHAYWQREQGRIAIQTLAEVPEIRRAFNDDVVQICRTAAISMGITDPTTVVGIDELETGEG